VEREDDRAEEEDWSDDILLPEDVDDKEVDARPIDCPEPPLPPPRILCNSGWKSTFQTLSVLLCGGITIILVSEGGWGVACIESVMTADAKETTRASIVADERTFMEEMTNVHKTKQENCCCR
jgi:hypothetical protein